MISLRNFRSWMPHQSQVLLMICSALCYQDDGFQISAPKSGISFLYKTIILSVVSGIASIIGYLLQEGKDVRGKKIGTYIFITSLVLWGVIGCMLLGKLLGVDVLVKIFLVIQNILSILQILVTIKDVYDKYNDSKEKKKGNGEFGF